MDDILTAMSSIRLAEEGQGLWECTSRSINMLKICKSPHKTHDVFVTHSLRQKERALG